MRKAHGASRKPVADNEQPITNHEYEHEYEDYKRLLFRRSGSSSRKAHGASRKPILARSGSSCSRPKTQDPRPFQRPFRNKLLPTYPGQ